MRSDHLDPAEREAASAEDHLVGELLRRYALTSNAAPAPDASDLVATATKRSPQCGRRLLALIHVLDATRAEH